MSCKTYYVSGYGFEEGVLDYSKIAKFVSGHGKSDLCKVVKASIDTGEAENIDDIETVVEEFGLYGTSSILAEEIAKETGVCPVAACYDENTGSYLVLLVPRYPFECVLKCPTITKDEYDRIAKDLAKEFYSEGFCNEFGYMTAVENG